MIGTVIQSKQFLELSECKAECLANDECFSINYQMNDDNTCELNNMALDSVTYFLQHFISRQGWSFMTSETKTRMRGSSCKELNPCRHDERCTDTCSCPGFQCIQTTVSQDCDSIGSNGKPISGVYWIKPYSFASEILQVFCSFDINHQGWVVIQRRVNSKTSFDRSWKDYKTGFGDLEGNYWIGLDNLNLLAGPGRNANLRIELKTSDNSSKILFALYNRFSVHDETENYRLTVGEYNESSSLQDGLSNAFAFSFQVHNDQMFSTKDRDHDKSVEENCALVRTGGWWFNSCGMSNLNGLLFNSSNMLGCSSTYSSSIQQYAIWIGNTDCQKGIISTEMKIRSRRN
eukprot:gene14493-5555_t